MKTQTNTNPRAIQMLPVQQLMPHPQNPRKHLGDLQELADSIRENGILQNLTVVEGDQGYTVIIGHRRLAAAVMAGLDAVPCTVAQMTPAEQIKTMLMENMQRSDLTPIEQADGFQMVLDMGMTFEEVARDSGFSQSTIRRRLKLRDLDRQTLEDRLTQGATLMDLVKLEQLEDEKVRNKVLATVGTNNFEYELKKALDAQTCKQNKPRYIEILDSFAEKIPKEEYNSRKWRHGGWYPLSRDPGEYKKPDDADTETYGYTMDATSFSLRKLRLDEDSESAREQSELELQVVATEAVLEASTETAFEIRLAFIKATTLKKKNVPDATAFLLTLLSKGNSMQDSTMNRMLDIPEGLSWSESRVARAEAFDNLMQHNPDKALLFMAYALSGDTKRQSFFETSYRNDRFPVYEENPRLASLYDFLELLGYQISDEEMLLMSGKHPAFEPGAEQLAQDLEEEDEEEDEEADDE